MAADRFALERLIERFSRAAGFPADAGHADIGTMHEGKTIPRRGLPKKMKAIGRTAGRFRALMANVFARGRTKLIPNFWRNATKLVGFIDLSREQRRGLPRLFRFDPRGKRPSTDDAEEKTDNQGQQCRPPGNRSLPNEHLHAVMAA